MKAWAWKFACLGMFLVPGVGGAKELRVQVVEESQGRTAGAKPVWVTYDYGGRRPLTGRLRIVLRGPEGEIAQGLIR